jgi:hypothetical protein
MAAQTVKNDRVTRGRGHARSVGSVGATSAQLGRRLDMWHRVNVGETALTRAGIGRVGRNWSGAPLTQSVTDSLVRVMYISTDPTN